MRIDGQRSFPDCPLPVPVIGVHDVVMVSAASAGERISASENGYASCFELYTLICITFGIVCLLHLLPVAIAPGMLEVESVCPIMGFIGFLRPGGSSFIRRWLERKKEESDGEADPASPDTDLSTGTPSDELESITVLRQQVDRLSLPKKEDNVSFLVDSPVVLVPRDEADAPTRSKDLEIEDFADIFFLDDEDGDIPHVPDESLPDDNPIPSPGSFSDDELMKMLGLDDGDADLEPPGEESVPVTPSSMVSEVVGWDDERPIESLIADLGSDDADLRAYAINAIAGRGVDAVEPLIRALAHAGDGERWCVAEALALIGEDSIPALITALGDVSGQIGAAATLVRIGSPAVPPLIAALASDDGEVQFGARYALCEIGNEAIPSLIEAFGASERSIRRSAASILREIGWEATDDAGAIRYLIADEAWLDVADYGVTAIEPLISILRSPDRGMWWNAARTLGEIGEAAVVPLVELLHEAGDEIHPLAAMALTEIGSPAVEALIGLLSIPPLSGTAATALVKIGEPAVEECIHALDSVEGKAEEALQNVLVALGEPAVPALIQSLISGRSRTRSQAAAVLARMNWEPWNDTEQAWYLIAREEWVELARLGQSAVDPLIRVLNGDDARIRCEAAAALGEIGEPAAIAPLIDALSDGAVAPVAADALVTIGAPVTVPVLGLLEARAGDVREYAVEVLGRLGAPEAVPAIIELLRAGEDRLHRKTVDALIGIGAPAAISLIPLLGEEGDGQAGATTALIGIGVPALEPLVRALNDEASSIRMGAARVLKKLGWIPERGAEEISYLIALQRWPDITLIGALAVDPLASRLGDLDPAVQAGAIKTLIGIGVPAISSLICLLDGESLHDPVTEALVGIGAPAVEPLVQSLDEVQFRDAAAGVLVRIGQPAAGALIPALGHPVIGPTAARVLEAMGEDAFDALIAALGDDDACIRQRAEDVLIGHGEVAAVPLIEALGNPGDAIRLGAIETLTRLGSPVLGLLTKALNDECYPVRLGAAEVLGRIGWEPLTENEAVCYLIAKEQWASVAAIGYGAVDPLIRTLGDTDSAIQVGAAHALGLIGAPAVARLIDELRVESDDTQRKAVEALKLIGEPAVVPLIDALQDRDWQIRLGAARALVGIRDPAIEPLILALRAAPPAVQMGAAATLGKIRSPAAVEPLIDALLLGDRRLGHVVVRALGMMGEPAIRPLLRVLKNGDNTSRKGAVEAFVMIGEPAARLLPGALTDEHFRVRAGVADALDRLNWSPSTAEETVIYLIAKERWSDLARSGVVAVEPLIQVLDDHDDSIRRRAARVLGEIGDPRAVSGLMNLLHDDFYSVRREVETAFIAIGVPAMESVVSALNDPDGDVRRRAADVLTEIGDARVIAPLERISDDEDWYARKAAENAVARIRERTE